MYTIQIIGAGYTGTRIAQFFAAEKQKVFALTRSVEKAKSFEAQKINPIIADLIKPETLTQIPPAHFIVICPAPDAVSSSSALAAQPRDRGNRDEAYEAIYLKGIGNYLNAIKKHPKPFLIVYLSSTGVWQDQSGDIFDETVAPTPVSKKAQILFEAEKQILNCGLPAAILRLSGIYGPGRNRIEAFQKSEWPGAGSDRWMNMIHVDDIAACLPTFFKNAKEGEVYLGTDDEPFLMSNLVHWLREKTGAKGNFSFSKDLPLGRRLKNTKFKDLGISLKYPTFREGYSELLRAEVKTHE